MAPSHIESLNALRPENDGPETIEDAIAAIAAQKAVYSERLFQLHQKLNDKTVRRSKKTILSMTFEISTLELAIKKATELVEQLRADLLARWKAELKDNLTSRLSDVVLRYSNLAERLRLFYKHLGGAHLTLLTEANSLNEDVKNIRNDIDKAKEIAENIKSGAPGISTELLKSTLTSRGNDVVSRFAALGECIRPFYATAEKARLDLVSEMKALERDIAKLRKNIDECTSKYGVGYDLLSGIPDLNHLTRH